MGEVGNEASEMCEKWDRSIHPRVIINLNAKDKPEEGDLQHLLGLTSISVMNSWEGTQLCSLDFRNLWG